MTAPHTLVHDRIVASNLEPIEQKPLRGGLT